MHRPQHKAANNLTLATSVLLNGAVAEKSRVERRP
jgi:hypothetical protein